MVRPTEIDANFFENITLQCRFCDEKDDGQPKNWYKADTLQKEPSEIIPDMENEPELNKVVIHSDRSLSIHNFTEEDGGLYFCRIYGENEVNTEFNYFVDVVDETFADIESGNLSDWKQYYEELFAPINKLFKESKGPEAVRVRDELKISMEIMTDWQRWSKCVCDKPGGKRVKTQKGVCRIKFRTELENNTIKYDKDMLFLKVGEISCRSIRLRKFFPDISNRTNVIPDFILSENCEETCSPDKDGANVGWKVGKTKGYKYKKTFVLMEKSHLTLICPESTLDNKVVWTKRGKTIKVGDTSYPHMYVDSFNTLYLVNMTTAEESNYTCQVDDIQMQRIVIHIVSKSKFLSGELVRHLGYLGFVLLLTVPCYCAGLVVTWWRRRSFQTYEDYMKEKRKIPYQDDESETLL
ncbi:uncharacterized protein LOC130894517 [Diorhabda carinulata]|uniref:uncharacterized protein LOC130894517 n=1 Tax=Diorhabda carinulata TaxID=1163345 RepID=UPI00259FEDE8|nr:uncharacterized protein LOC130894517 [Diorhabda carinulata]